MDTQAMISIEECNEIVTRISPLLVAEKVDLANSLGRILAKQVIADTDQPPFDKSAMDGYACKRSDLLLPLAVIGVIAAGTKVEKPIITGECYRIFTGAPVPPGADCVIMQEDTLVDEHGLVHFTAPQTKTNICFKGEDSKVGNVAIGAGTKIQPQHLAIMAGYGVTQPQVARKVSVVLFCSGSELVEPHEKPSGATIRNSNASQLLGQLIASGANAAYKGIVADNLETVTNALKMGIGTTDVIIITGGASVGDFDLIPNALKTLGAKIIFSALNIQPGKPVLYATIGNTHILGLSGNPVSSFLQYLLVVAPILLRLMGATQFLPKIAKVPLKASISRKKGNRQVFIPVSISNEWQAEPLSFNGSAHIGALAAANGFAILAPNTLTLGVSEMADIIIF